MPNGFDDDQTRSFTSIAVGTKVSHYTIISKIGAGGMGEVYLAEDSQLITGSTLTGRKVNIPLKEVLYLKVNKFDLLNTALAIVIPTVLFFLVKNNPPIPVLEITTN